MANKICDFCLEEGKGLFRQPERLADGHYICKNCRKKIESYDLPVKYDLFQLLVTSEPYMREMMMGDYLEHHKPAEAIAKYFPLTQMILHEGEHCVNMRKAVITVDATAIPIGAAVTRIADIGRKDIINLSDATSASNAKEVEGVLYETDAAIYFMAPTFINCHRLTSVVSEHTDTDAVHVLEHGKEFTYATPHADLFHLRSTFYHMAVAAATNKKKSLIYLASENTMTLTSGKYNVPKNIKSGVYWVNPVDEAALQVRDANGKVRSVSAGRVRIDNGSTLEVNGEYQFRYNKREPKEDEPQNS
ncbi:MAG: hypothetical protein IJ225_06710 [Solobacterium sp.]|nr:hypothetical protein [Solobacterium sp.]